MTEFAILAQAQEQAQTQSQSGEGVFFPVDFFWQQMTSLSWIQAVLAVSFGVVYLLYGWRIFKILVVICFGLAGLFLGVHFADGLQSSIWAGAVGMGILIFVASSLTKWCVGLLGAAAGGTLTGGLWYAFDLPVEYIWAGAVIGIVAGGMISFIVFKASVMLFTSLGGGAIIIMGFMRLLHLYETTLLDPPSNYVENLILFHKWFLPTALIVPTVVGIIMQNRLIKHSKKWEL